MFTINAHNNPYLRVDQQTTQALLSVGLDSAAGLAPAPLTLAIALDHSGSMEGERMSAARDGAIKVVQAVDETMNFLLVTFDNYARIIVDAPNGTADIIPTPRQVAMAFANSFNEMRKTALMNVRLSLWSPVGVTITRIQQVYPTLVPLGLQPDPANARQQIVDLGSFAAGDQYEYLCDFETPIYPPGQQFLLLRPGMKYFAAGTGEQEEKSAREGWVFAQWTEDAAQAAQIEPHIAHYTNQEELSQRIQEGQAALAAGDNERATRLLGEALEISERTHNERITELLGTSVLKDAKGTIRLNKQADVIARINHTINDSRTSKLK